MTYNEKKDFVLPRYRQDVEDNSRDEGRKMKIDFMKVVLITIGIAFCVAGVSYALMGLSHETEKQSRSILGFSIKNSWKRVKEKYKSLKDKATESLKQKRKLWTKKAVIGAKVLSAEAAKFSKKTPKKTSKKTSKKSSKKRSEKPSEKTRKKTRKKTGKKTRKKTPKKTRKKTRKKPSKKSPKKTSEEASWGNFEEPPKKSSEKPSEEWIQTMKSYSAKFEEALKGVKCKNHLSKEEVYTVEGLKIEYEDDGETMVKFNWIKRTAELSVK